MPGKRKSSSSRVVTYSVETKADLSGIYKFNRKKWGKDQAIAYRLFLTATIKEYAQNPARAPLAEDTDGYRMGLAVWPGARDGHYIFFREIPNGIFVLRILHTKMNWPDDI